VDQPTSILGFAGSLRKGMFPVNRPEVFVSFAPQKFDEKGRLLDDKTKEVMKQLLVNLVA
jgi:hypothetical protein